MKRTPKFMLLASVMALGLAGCGTTAASSSTPGTSSNGTSQTTSSGASSAPASSSSTPSSSTTSSSSSTAPEPITHRDAFVTAMPEGAVIRDYDSRFDEKLDDFSSETLTGTNTNGIHNTTNYLRVLVDSTAVGYPNSADASIYKMATGTYALQNYEGIGFKIRLTSGKLNYSNLVLALRGDDTFQTYPINLAEAKTPDGEALPTLSAEWQDVIISPNQSISDDNSVYKNTDGTDSTVKVLSKILGFHLYALSEECSAVIEIKEVFLNNAGTNTTVDNFSRAKVNKTDDTVWWRDSTGAILNQYLYLKDGASYKTLANTNVATYEDVALGVMGDTSGATLTPVYADKEGTGVAWSALKDPSGTAVVNAVDGAFYPYVVNLSQSGITATNLVGWKISSSKELYLNSIVATSLAEPQLTTEYPHLDTAKAKVFDSFTRTQAKLDTTYDAASTNTVVTDSGLNFSICYSGVDNVSVDGDNLVLAPNAGYTQVTEGSKTACGNNQYMVFVMKLGEGADLNNFRINSNNSGVVYAKDWRAAEGLASIPSDLTTYPYQNNGYVWYVIDLAVSGMTATDLMDIYYTGTGTVYIDSIFFANTYSGAAEVALGTGGSVSLDGSYHYMCGIANPGTFDKIGIYATGDGTNANFSTFRLQYNSATIWANAALVITDKDGVKIDPTTAIPATETFYIIDLKASGFTMAADTMHFHWDGAGATGTVTIGKIVGLTPEYAAQWGVGGSVSLDGGYHYMYGGKCDGTMSSLKFSVTGDGTNATLATFRIEYNSSMIWANAKLVIKDEKGATVDPSAVIPAAGETLYIDLAASGFTTGVEADMHFHWDGAGASGTVSVGTVYGVASTIPYKAALAAYVEHA
jgi:hypothetical protein